MRNLKLTVLRYDGTDFFGWQTQPGRRTVQETLEHAIQSEITREDRVRVELRAGERTPASTPSGRWRTSTPRRELDCETLLKAINAKLPGRRVPCGR